MLSKLTLWQLTRAIPSRAVQFSGIALCSLIGMCPLSTLVAAPPNIVLVMADDQGWGETGFYDHEVLKTPRLDEMAENGLRFDRFYAAAPVCSPTRASVMTGRSNNRTGVESHGFALRLQEKTLPQALRQAGFKTGHFGKWHLNGIRGPGVPVLAEDTHNPGVFGFQTWLSVTNFFDRNPLLSRLGKFEDYQGDSSEVVVAQALEFIAAQAATGEPSFTVIWFGTPHSPFVASEEDREKFSKLDTQSQHHYGELVAMDRSIGALRDGLRQLGIADNTLLWFTSDNGGLPKISPGTVGNLRGFKGTIYEGGLRVPAIIEWPGGIETARVTEYPACAMDIFPTIAEVVSLPSDSMLQPQDGVSLTPLFTRVLDPPRTNPIPFNYMGETAIVDNQFKLLEIGRRAGKHLELYNLADDPGESKDLASELPDVVERLEKTMRAWQAELAKSVAGSDYPEGTVNPGEPQPRRWTELDSYRKYFDQWQRRPEYRDTIGKSRQ